MLKQNVNATELLFMGLNTPLLITMLRITTCFLKGWIHQIYDSQFVKVTFGNDTSKFLKIIDAVAVQKSLDQN